MKRYYTPHEGEDRGLGQGEPIAQAGRPPPPRDGFLGAASGGAIPGSDGTQGIRFVKPSEVESVPAPAGR
jgi:hypothetical protein